ncbi:rod shape-determining protein MreC [Candidatus Nitrospira bockiana]
MLRSLSSATRLILLLLALLLSVIFLLPKHTRDVLQSVGRPASFLVSFPLEGLASFQRSLADVWQEYVALRQVREENRQLRRELEQLRLQQGELREWAIAGQRLAGLLQFKERFAPQTVAAQIIGRDPSNWYRGVILNKGERDGIAPEMGVMTPAGAVGRVVKAGPSTSVVLLVTDPNNAITGIVQRTRDEGIVEGTLDGRARIKYLPLLANVRVGDLVVTSGLTGGFPRGIAIGTIQSMQKEEGEVFQSAQILPEVDMTKLEEVLVITVPRDVVDSGGAKER